MEELSMDHDQSLDKQQEATDVIRNDFAHYFGFC